LLCGGVLNQRNIGIDPRSLPASLPIDGTVPFPLRSPMRYRVNC
jgi:hypothetical protein